jgi:hypothetical protein
MRLGTLLLVLALLAVGCSARDEDDAPAAASAEPVRRYLAYMRFAEGRPDEVWLARADGTRKRRLVSGRNPSVSPNGRWVAYNGGCDRDNVCRTLEFVPTGGGRATLVSRRARFHKWTPASDRIVFRTDRGLASYALKTRRRTQLVSLPNDWGFSIAPSGAEVVYAVGRAGSQAYFGASKVDLYVVGVGGGSPKRLTTDGRSAYPVWGPNGIAFSRLLPHEGWGRHEIWRIRPDGSGRRTITGRLPARLVVSGVVGLRPVAWSANGRRLLAGLDNEFGAKPYAVDPVRGTIRELGDFGWAASPDAISRDGRFVLVSAAGSGDGVDEDTRVAIVPWSGGPGRVVARLAGVASWNR